MKLTGFRKVWDGKYLKNYEIAYLNKAGREKRYEIVSRRDIRTADELGKKVSGISIVGFSGDRLLLLKEFRMSVGRTIINLCAGMLEAGETLEDCIRRELYEETGLSVKRIVKILPPSYSAVGFSDVSTQIAIVEVEGEISDHTSANESIKAALYTRTEVAELLETEKFSSRSQLAAYFFVNGFGKTLDK